MKQRSFYFQHLTLRQEWLIEFSRTIMSTSFALRSSVNFPEKQGRDHIQGLDAIPLSQRLTLGENRITRSSDWRFEEHDPVMDAYRSSQVTEFFSRLFHWLPLFENNNVEKQELMYETNNKSEITYTGVSIDSSSFDGFSVSVQSLSRRSSSPSSHASNEDWWIVWDTSAVFASCWWCHSDDGDWHAGYGWG